MPVFCEFISVIILRDSIDKYFQGGWQRFVLELPNRSMCTDGEVVRVGFMNPNDTYMYIDDLKNGGLQYNQSINHSSTIREIDDIAGLDHKIGGRDKRDWLKFGDRKFDNREYFCCWLKGTSIETLAFPSELVVRPVPIFITPNEFTESYSFVRSENDLDIFIESKSRLKLEFYLPQGMDIEGYYAQSEERRKKSEARTLEMQAKKEERKRLAKAVEKDEEKKRAEKSKDKKSTKKLVVRLGTKERAAQINRGGVTMTHLWRNKPKSEQKKAQERQQAEEKKTEDELYAKVAKTLKQKTVDRNNPTDVLEALIANALNANDEKDLKLIEDFWSANYPSYFSLLEDSDDFYVSVDPKEIIMDMKLYWNDYFELDESEVSDEDKFLQFKGLVEGRLENVGSDIVKKVGKFGLSAYCSDPRENKALSDFEVFQDVQSIHDWYKKSGLVYYVADGLNYSDQEMRDYFDEHYLKS
jgi:hypothetical protein